MEIQVDVLCFHAVRRCFLISLGTRAAHSLPVWPGIAQGQKHNFYEQKRSDNILMMDAWPYRPAGSIRCCLGHQSSRIIGIYFPEWHCLGWNLPGRLTNRAPVCSLWCWRTQCHRFTVQGIASGGAIVTERFNHCSRCSYFRIEIGIKAERDNSRNRHKTAMTNYAAAYSADTSIDCGLSLSLNCTFSYLLAYPIYSVTPNLF